MKSFFTLTALATIAAASLASAAGVAFDPNGANVPFNANDFQCIDDTNFKQFQNDGSFTKGACPPGFCQTRKPRKKNPCVGAANAQRIDGFTIPAAGAAVDAPPAKKADGKKAKGKKAGKKAEAPAAPPAVETVAAFDPNGADVAINANDFQCIDDTNFKQFKGDGSFTKGACAPGFCQTRKPRKKNPCVGAANAQRIDGFTIPAAGAAAGEAEPAAEAEPPVQEETPAAADAGAVAAFDPNGADVPFNANDFQCIDDTNFKQFKGDGSFTKGACAPGFCQTR
ncbi:hypothetical protein HDU97_008188, partial [Phlyctochytrium planicorne]